MWKMNSQTNGESTEFEPKESWIQAMEVFNNQIPEEQHSKDYLTG